MKKMKYTGNFRCGLCSVSFRDRTAEEILTAMNDAGLKYIEWGSDIHAPSGDTQKLKQIAELQEKYGVSCSSYGTYYRLGHTPDTELLHYIRAAKMLGTRVLRLWCGVKNSELLSYPERDALMDCCRYAAGIAEDEGVVLAMECHGGTYTNTTESILELMNEINSPAFRMYWQPNQYRSFEDNLAQAKAVAQYTVNIHAFNWIGAERFPLAESTEMWRDYLSEFSGKATVLLEFMPDDNIESLAAEAEALGKIIRG